MKVLASNPQPSSGLPAGGLFGGVMSLLGKGFRERTAWAAARPDRASRPVAGETAVLSPAPPEAVAIFQGGQPSRLSGKTGVPPVIPLGRPWQSCCISSSDSRDDCLPSQAARMFSTPLSSRAIRGQILLFH